MFLAWCMMPSPLPPPASQRRSSRRGRSVVPPALIPQASPGLWLSWSATKASSRRESWTSSERSWCAFTRAETSIRMCWESTSPWRCNVHSTAVFNTPAYSVSTLSWWSLVLREHSGKANLSTNFDLLSHTAFEKEKVRLTVMGNTFTHWLPLCKCFWWSSHGMGTVWMDG